MIVPIQIQCGHVICNGCLQTLMSYDENISRCPICKEGIFEYKSLRSQRIRRPRDKSAPYLHVSESDEEDLEYQPPASRNDNNEEFDDQHVDPADAISQPVEPGDEIIEQTSQRSRSQSQPLDLSLRHSTPNIRVRSVSVESQPLVIDEGSPPIDNAVDDQQPNASQVSRHSGRDSVEIIAFIPPARQSTSPMPDTIEYEDVDRIIDHRGRGRNIRYLVRYHDGSENWEPMAHMNRCQVELGAYRRRCKVVNQQAYRIRVANRQRML